LIDVGIGRSESVLYAGVRSSIKRGFRLWLSIQVQDLVAGGLKN
jgi:hypothetical protein